VDGDSVALALVASGRRVNARAEPTLDPSLRPYSQAGRRAAEQALRVAAATAVDRVAAARQSPPLPGGRCRRDVLALTRYAADRRQFEQPIR
jgi:hypothetical protein